MSVGAVTEPSAVDDAPVDAYQSPPLAHVWRKDG
jgi:hypothetical protein